MQASDPLLVTSLRLFQVSRRSFTVPRMPPRGAIYKSSSSCLLHWELRFCTSHCCNPFILGGLLASSSCLVSNGLPSPRAPFLCPRLTYVNLSPISLTLPDSLLPLHVHQKSTCPEQSTFLFLWLLGLKPNLRIFLNKVTLHHAEQQTNWPMLINCRVSQHHC